MSSPTNAAKLTLSPAEQAAIRKAMQFRDGPERRRDSRISLCDRDFQLLVRIGDGGHLMNVTARDISASGIGFYHVAYVHPDTRVQLVMKGAGTDALSAAGTVVRCQHVNGRVHEVGVLFDDRIELGVVVKGAGGSVGAGERLDIAEVYARIAQLGQQVRELADHKQELGTILQRVGALAELLIQNGGDAEAAPASTKPKPSQG